MFVLKGVKNIMSCKHVREFEAWQSFQAKLHFWYQIHLNFLARACGRIDDYQSLADTDKSSTMSLCPSPRPNQTRTRTRDFLRLRTQIRKRTRTKSALRTRVQTRTRTRTRALHGRTSFIRPADHGERSTFVLEVDCPDKNLVRHRQLTRENLGHGFGHACPTNSDDNLRFYVT